MPMRGDLAVPAIPPARDAKANHADAWIIYRRDACLDQPAEELAGAIGRVGKAVWASSLASARYA